MTLPYSPSQLPNTNKQGFATVLAANWCSCGASGQILRFPFCSLPQKLFQLCHEKSTTPPSFVMSFKAGGCGEWRISSPHSANNSSPKMLCCEVKSLIRVVIASFYKGSKLQASWRSRQASWGNIGPKWVSWQILAHPSGSLLGHCYSKIWANLRLITARLKWLNIDLCILCSAACWLCQSTAVLSSCDMCIVHVYGLNIFYCAAGNMAAALFSVLFSNESTAAT